jgi:hypothetical protein
MKLNGTHELLGHADDVNVFGDNENTIKRNAEAPNDASNEDGLEVKTENHVDVDVS